MTRDLPQAPSRRQLLAGLVGLASYGLSRPALADPGAATEIALARVGSGITGKDLLQIDKTAKPTTAGLPDTRGLWVRNPHTGEEATTLFWVAGLYDNVGYTAICTLMRDWRENERVAMDPKLFHLLWAIQRGSGFTRPLVINSGYRTPTTNKKLRAEGAAINSLHMHKKACDLVLDGINPEKVAEYVHSMEIGGVGHYPTFTHIDTGPIRTWPGGKKT